MGNWPFTRSSIHHPMYEVTLLKSVYRESFFGDYPGSTKVRCLKILVSSKLSQSFELVMDEQNKEYVQVEYMGKPA